MVVVGIDPAAMVTDSQFVVVKDGSSVVIDGFSLKAVGTAASEFLDGIPRKLLCPPGGKVESSVSVSFEAVECRTLKLALAIL